jgi:hypothetical protein
MPTLQTHFVFVFTVLRHPRHSLPKLGGDALAQRGLGRSVQIRKVPIKKERFAGI